ncbi:MAG: methionyl-tRNA formyltransferase [Parcubacteria group bacterium]|nr:methionyl-tRNA formyltransferase [Parcubacteria group bacterium]
MKIVFFGTSEFAALILQTIKERTDWDIALVITEPAKAVGRKQEITESPVSVYARQADLEIITPPSLKDTRVVDQIGSAKADIMILVAYGKLIPPEIFNLPPHKTVNIHPSLLPQLRGPSPIQTALLEGLKETGVSLMIIDEKIDHGPVISQETITIDDDDNYITLEAKLAELGGQMIIRNAPRYISGELKPQEQDHARATFTKMIKKEDGLVDWHKSADEIFNQWRAFIKWPGVYTFFTHSTSSGLASGRSDLPLEVGPRSQPVRLKLIDIKKVEHDHKHPPGTVFLSENKELLIACSHGVIKLIRLQPENSKILTAQEFLNGYKYIIAQVLT